MIVTLSSPLMTETSLTTIVGDQPSVSSNLSPETSPASKSTIFISKPTVSRQRRASIKGTSRSGGRATLVAY